MNVYCIDLSDPFHFLKSWFYAFFSSNCSSTLLLTGKFWEFILPTVPTSSSIVQFSSCTLQSILTLASCRHCSCACHHWPFCYKTQWAHDGLFFLHVLFEAFKNYCPYIFYGVLFSLGYRSQHYDFPANSLMVSFPSTTYFIGLAKCC